NLNNFILPVFIVINFILSAYFYKKITIKIYGIKAEYKVYRKLKVIKKHGYKVFQNINLKNKDIKAQLDFIIIGVTGIFIVEVKSLRGNITGKFDDKYLMKTKKSKAGNEYNKKVYNPIKQVSTHVYKLSTILKENGVNKWIKGIVLFSNKDLKVNIEMGDNTVNIFESVDEVIRYILNYENNLTENDIENIEKVLLKNMK
ncbi:nuclease-related domain-containing protein, partial [Clostridiaceae bacterium HSG29]|nr:nuclease-related domain-containing protein [Clostridiaceae bacterium HSG29]